MADIDVERKRSSPLLPWILGLLLVAALAWGLWALLRGGDDRDPVAVAGAGDTVAAAPGAAPVAGGPAAAGDVVQSFQQQCTDAPEEMARDHAFLADCLRRLAAAADTLLARPAAREVEARGELEEVRRRADALDESPPDATDHAALASGAFTSVAALLERMQREAFTGARGEVAEVRSAATGLRPDVPLLEQRDQVQAFFERAGAALQGMMMAPAGG